MRGTYGQSVNGNFKVIDAIGVPHPYCIGPKHVAHAADYHGGVLDGNAIREAESRLGAKCCICEGKLSYDGHEQALLVACYADFHTDDSVKQELHQYLLSVKDECEQNGYAGFAFVKR